MTDEQDTRDRYAQLVSDEPILTQTGMQERTKDVDYEDDDDVRVFYSSGDEPKRIPLSPDDQEQVAQGFADTFRTSGIDEDDVGLNLGKLADNHMSGWCFHHGPDTLGTDVVNTSVADFDDDAVRDRWDEVTVVMSLPRMLHALGEQIEDEYGDLTEQFPNVETSLTAGDTFPQSLRDTVKDQWGLDRVRQFYAGTEMGAVAAEDGQGPGMVQTNDNLYLELLEPDTDVAADQDTVQIREDAITSVYDIDEPMTGPILISAPDRELFPYTRYRVGDVFTVEPADDGPRLTFEGREDRVINLSGAMVYPREIENAVNAYGASDGYAVMSVEDDYAVMNMYLEGSAEEDIVPYLADENGSIHAWYDSGAIKIRQHGYTSDDELATALEQYNLDVDIPTDAPKQRTVAFDSSYRDMFDAGG